MFTYVFMFSAPCTPFENTLPQGKASALFVHAHERQCKGKDKFAPSPTFPCFFFRFRTEIHTFTKNFSILVVTNHPTLRI